MCATRAKFEKHWVPPTTGGSEQTGDQPGQMFASVRTCTPALPALKALPAKARAALKQTEVVLEHYGFFLGKT